MKTFFVDFTNGAREAFQAEGVRIEGNIVYLWKYAEKTSIYEPVAMISVYNMTYITVAEADKGK